ncbi:F0F1 ATP synthase subunit gamma [Rhodobacteraceae bacterium NNCM2]|nr:F0F1 ATP synthase subunit gamma [Coraliihabitans acroporae]
MTNRIADVSARIEGIRQLGMVVNAMKGIAAARARAAAAQVAAVDRYAAIITSAMASVIAGRVTHESKNARRGGDSRTGLLVFCAEQGFAGAFSERVLDALGDEMEAAQIFLVGTRGQMVAAARGLTPVWSSAMPSHTPGIPKLADRITGEIYRSIDSGRIDRLDVVHGSRVSGHLEINRQTLFPVDLPRAENQTTPPLTQLPTDDLVARLGADYVHSQICKAALHAFAAENETRMETMSSAGHQIERELETFEALLRTVRQEEITAEIIELSTGTMAATSRGKRKRSARTEIK